MILEPSPDRLRARMDRLAPPLSLAEVQARPTPVVASRVRPLLVAASLALVLGLVGVVVATSGGGDPSDGVHANRPDPSPDGAGPPTAPPTTAPTPSEPRGGGASPRRWPEVLSAVGTRPEVVVSDLATGEVLDRVHPSGLAGGGLTGATGAHDGRIATWSGARIAVRDGDATYERSLVDPAVAAVTGGSLRVLLVPAEPAAWIVASTGSSVQVLRWDYVADALVPVATDLLTGTLPAGVGADGELVLGHVDPQAVPGPGLATVTVVGPDLDAPPRTVEGEALAVHGTRALVRRCPAAGSCDLVAVDLAGGTEAEIATGTVDPAAVRSLIGPTVPADTAPLPTGDQGSSRVLVGVALGPPGAQDQPVAVAVVDLERHRLEVLPGRPGSLVAAAWSCDGASVARLEAGGVWRTVPVGAEDGEGQEAGSLPPGTFLYGLGRC